MLKGSRGLIVTLLGAAAIIALAITFGFRGPKDDVAIARAFLDHLAADEITQAYALLHSSVTDTTPQSTLQNLAAEMEPFADTSFPSFSFSTVNGSRTSEFTGTGTTADGCESNLEFILLNGAISFFNVDPICGSAAGTDA